MKALQVAAVAALVAAATATGFAIRGAGADGAPSSLTSMTPCRLIDTRPGPDHVGERGGAFGPGESATVAVVGNHGNCTIPAGATGISANVTIANPTRAGFLTLYPSGTSRPTASNLNWQPGQAATPNQVVVGLTAGNVDVFNYDGAVDVIIDINGYYAALPAAAAPTSAWGRISGFPATPTIAAGSANVAAVYRSNPHTGYGPAAGSYCVAFTAPIAVERLRSAVVSTAYGDNWSIAENATGNYCAAGELGVLLFDKDTSGGTKNGTFNFIIP